MGQMKTLSDLYEKSVNVVQRRKQARRMAKLQKSPSFQFKKKKAALKMRTPAKIMQLARKKLIQQFRDKFYPGYKEMSVQQRVKTDQLIMQRYGAKIDKLSKKMAMKIKGDEGNRIKAARERMKD
jgi:hypothetical protein|tara:strand:+ start:395 stop:769 length:375 start_codon:yes stop_codon:yes gene_type:complete